MLLLHRSNIHRLTFASVNSLSSKSRRYFLFCFRRGNFSLDRVNSSVLTLYRGPQRSKSLCRSVSFNFRSFTLTERTTLRSTGCPSPKYVCDLNFRIWFSAGGSNGLAKAKEQDICQWRCDVRRYSFSCNSSLQFNFGSSNSVFRRYCRTVRIFSNKSWPSDVWSSKLNFSMLSMSYFRCALRRPTDRAALTAVVEKVRRPVARNTAWKWLAILSTEK